MATPVSNVIYDGFGDFAAGMDSGVAPTLLPKNQMGYAANVTVRGGFATDRPAWRRIGLNFGGDLGLQTLFENALWQGAENYQPDVGLESLICSIGGQLFNIIPDAKGNATVANISIPGDPNPVNQPQAWLKQAENFMIVNDGASLPLLYDGSTTRRSIGGQEIILGTTSLNFLVPAIGAEGTATLIGPFLGYFGETVLIGGATYQVPMEVTPARQVSLAMRWIVQYADNRRGMPMAEALAAELKDAAAGQGNAIKKRDDTHKMAQANRAFAHFRW